MNTVEHAATKFAEDVLGLLSKKAIGEVEALLGGKHSRPRHVSAADLGLKPKRDRKLARMRSQLKKNSEASKRFKEMKRAQAKPAPGLRDAILEHIRQNPGSTKHGLAKRFKITYDSAHSHVRQLARAGSIVRSNTTSGGRAADGLWQVA